ncbi:uncharacterized protein FOKN1_2993 [Thiohalobacter thiocyanaticus]|uniref:Uncharacterized protein n=1 Tax=Thiohalobacter thiocyanaticus TaxID=585455 RepID=A0A1Z4VUP9_9GAMM|nr:hypothetical protein [Thiohalobacter thiocyanaticus]BAZ95350.1 uncharacterized protein FOKN1_2993 [Thiohalobacter thiocyanaticus]
MKADLLLVLGMIASAAVPGLSLAGETPTEDCIELIEYSVGEPDEGYGIVEIEWQARVRNRCDQSHYATLTLQFLDAEGESLHDSQTRSVIDPGPAVVISKLAMLDEEQAERYTGTRLRIGGQALP